MFVRCNCVFLRMKKKPRPAIDITAKPPTTPPAMAPALFGLEDGGGVGAVDGVMVGVGVDETDWGVVGDIASSPAAGEYTDSL